MSDLENLKMPEKMREHLEDLQTQYGPANGKLAMAMDLLSDAEITAGQLTVYCRNGLDPRKPHPDLESLQLYVRAIRVLVREAFRERRAGGGVETKAAEE